MESLPSLVGTNDVERLRVRTDRSTPYRLLELLAELADGRLHRPARAVGQSADCCTRHDADAIRHVDQNIEILAPPAPPANAVDDLEHPSRPFAARRALPATLVAEELANVVKHIDHRGLVVDDRDGRGPETQTRHAPRSIEVERDVVLSLSILPIEGRIAIDEPHRQPARVHRLRLPPLPHSA